MQTRPHTHTHLHWQVNGGGDGDALALGDSNGSGEADLGLCQVEGASDGDNIKYLVALGRRRPLRATCTAMDASSKR